MPAKAGAAHHHAGPHLPSGPPDLSHDENLADPADGADVPRCLTCGVPAGDEPIMTFALLLLPGRQAAGWYRLCGRCYRHANPPVPADPLDVTEAA